MTDQEYEKKMSAALTKLRDTLISEEFLQLGSVTLVISLLRAYADELEILDIELRLKDLKDIKDDNSKN